MENSEISWCDHTHNHWEGCTKVSPGCAHCYAEARDKRFTGGLHWGAGAPRRLTSLANRNKPHRWNRAAAEALKDHSEECAKDISYGQHVKPPARPRVFCSSLADWLDDEVPADWLRDLLNLVAETPHLDWLLLTKRPQNWLKRITLASSISTNGEKPAAGKRLLEDWIMGTAPANVWLGTTVEDQQRADERIPELIKVPARVRFLSCEPLLGPVNLSMRTQRMEMVPGIHWVICGGESGPGARPMHPDWARSLRDQCAATGVAFHFKQWGEWIARSQYLYVGNEPLVQAFGAGGKFTSAVMRRDGRIDESLGEASTTNDSDSAIVRVGKKLSGRLLDGMRHDAFPTV